MSKQLSKSQVLQLAIKYIEDCYPIYEQLLREFCQFKSISDNPENRVDVVKAIRWYGTRLENVGFKVTYHSTLWKERNYHKFPDSEEVEFPEFAVAEMGNDPLKETVLIYGHVDVKEITKRDKPLDTPWELAISNGFYKGHGILDGKAALICWIAAIDALKKVDILPVNFKVVVEGLASSTSETLEYQLNELKPTVLKSIDHVALSEGFWLGHKKPCLIYGCRGNVYFYITIQGASRDLHSGLHGGAITEPMADVNAILNSLIDQDGHILIPDIFEGMEEEDKKEIERWHSIEFTTAGYKFQTSTCGMHSNCRIELLKRRWIQPELTIHGVEYAMEEKGAYRLIPHKVLAKFSLRPVMCMSMSKTIRKVVDYVKAQFRLRNSANKMTVKAFRGADPMLSDIECINYKCASEAILYNWGVKPDLIRDGGTIPAASVLERITMRDVCIFPLAFYSNAEASNDAIPLANIRMAMKTFVTYFMYIGTRFTEFSEVRDERQRKKKAKRDKLL